MKRLIETRYRQPPAVDAADPSPGHRQPNRTTDRDPTVDPLGSGHGGHGPGQGRSARVTVRYPDDRSVVHEVEAAVAYVGRHPSCDVGIALPFVGARHLLMCLVEHGARIIDLGAPAGTCIDGTPVQALTEHYVDAQSSIEIGPLVLLIEPVIDGKETLHQPAEDAKDTKGDGMMSDETATRSAQPAHDNRELTHDSGRRPTSRFGPQPPVPRDTTRDGLMAPHPRRATDPKDKRTAHPLDLMGWVRHAPPFPSSPPRALQPARWGIDLPWIHVLAIAGGIVTFLAGTMLLAVLLL